MAPRKYTEEQMTERRRAQNKEAARRWRGNQKERHNILVTEELESCAKNTALQAKNRELTQEKNAMLLELNKYKGSTSSQSSGLAVNKIFRNMSIDESKEKGEANRLPKINSATMPTLTSTRKVDRREQQLLRYAARSLENRVLSKPQLDNS